MRSLKALFHGLGFLIQGFQVLKTHPSLLIFATIPFLIDLVAFIAGIYFGTMFISAWVAWAVSFMVSPDAGLWYSVFYYPILVLLWVAFLVLLGYSVFVIGMIIASPFHALLAERTLMKLGAIQPEPFRFNSWIKNSWQMFKVSLKKLMVFIALGVFIFILSFIPIVNLVGSFMACLIVAFDAMDYSFEANTWNFNRRKGFFKAELPLFAGMGMALSLTMLIPGLTLLFYPIAVIGAAANFASVTGSTTKEPHATGSHSSRHL